MKDKKVIIGIVAKHINIEQAKINSLIRDEVKQAIFDNGGIAIGIISPNDDIIYAGNDWKEHENKIRKEEIMVNSRHKNSIKDCPELNKVAFCEDGYPDALKILTKISIWVLDFIQKVCIRQIKT